MSLTLGKEQFIEKVKKWVYIDSQIKLINEKMHTLREEKSALNQDICTYLETHQMKHRKINIHDGNLKMHEKKEYTCLSFGFIEKCLKEIINDEKQIEFIIQYLKSKREMTLSTEIKRIYK